MVESEPRRPREYRGLPPCEKRPVADILLRLGPIPHEGGDAAAVGRGKDLAVSDGDLDAAQRVEIFVGEPGRLPDPVDVHQAEAAVERVRRRAGFVKDVGVRPIAHALQIAFRALELGQNPRRADVAVVHRIARRVARAPLREIEREVRVFRALDLRPNVADVTDDRFLDGRQFCIRLTVLIETPAIHPVRMCGHKIDRRTACGDMIEELRHPCGASRGRPADAKLRIHGLQGA